MADDYYRDKAKDKLWFFAFFVQMEQKKFEITDTRVVKIHSSRFVEEKVWRVWIPPLLLAQLKLVNPIRYYKSQGLCGRFKNFSSFVGGFGETAGNKRKKNRDCL